MGSTRLPNKVLLPIAGKPSLEFLILRLKTCKTLNEIVVATSTEQSNLLIEYYAGINRVSCFRGSEDNVLNRVTRAAEFFKADIIVDITGDCPFVDPTEVDYLVGLFFAGNYDYVSNVWPKRYLPDGMDVQVYSIAALRAVDNNRIPGKFHVGWNIAEREEFFKRPADKQPDFFNRPLLGLTLDTKEDLLFMNKIAEQFIGCYFSLRNILEKLDEMPELLEINCNIKRKVPADG